MSRVIKDAEGNSVPVQRGEVYKVSPEAIIVDWEKNGRMSKPDVTALKHSIQSVGQLQPVICRKAGGNRVELVAGYCRVEAIKQINAERAKGEEEMPVTIMVHDVNDEEAFIRNLQENMARNETSPMDDAHNLRRLKDTFGKSVSEIATLLSKTETWVRNTQKLLSLDTKTQNLLHKGELAWSAGIMLAGVEESKRREIVNELDAEAEQKFEEAKARVEKSATKTAKAEVVDVSKDLADAEAKTEVSEPKTVATGKAPAKVPVKRIETKAVAKKVREAGSTASIATPNRSAIKDFFEGMTGPGETELCRKTAGLILDFMAGKVSDQAAEKKLRKLLSGTAE